MHETDLRISLKTDDGILLRLRHQEPENPPCGQVLLVHGLGEHVARYAALATALTDSGWRVTGYDHRGHGQSGGARGRIARHDSLMSDLSIVMDSIYAASPGPLVLLGHSLGGLVVARFAAEALQPEPAAWMRPVDAIALSSPALDPGLSTFQAWQIAVASRLAPNLAVNNGLDPQKICTDPAVVQAYRRDPLVHDRISGRLARFIRDDGRWVESLAPRWTVPTLLMWAGADECVSPEGSARFAKAAPPGRVEARAWPGLAHEIFNEPEKDEVTSVLLDWLETLR
jgi:alpha-beta hydrolase superfamily lysophospholipase